MKTIFRIFSRVWFLNFIAIFILLVTLLWLVIGVKVLIQVGFIDFINSYTYGIVLFAGFLCVNIWFLTGTFFPIIKINSNGISAYSIFWTRYLGWDEVQSAKLVKMSTRASGHASFSSTSVSLENTLQHETKNIAFLNKGVRVNTFIIISGGKIPNQKVFSLGLQLMNHGKMTTKQEIAFEFDENAWKEIQSKLNSNDC